MIQTEEDILKQATEEFRQNGLKFTMNDVATTLHIAKKTIYQFYPSKEELLMAMLDYGFEKIHAKKKEIIESDLEDLDKIRKVMIAMPDQFTLIDFKMLADLQDKYPAVYQRLRTHLETDWEPVLNLLQKGIEEGYLNAISIPVLRTMITATIESFLSTDVLNDYRIPYQEALQSMMDIVMGGITSPQHLIHKDLQ